MVMRFLTFLYLGIWMTGILPAVAASDVPPSKITYQRATRHLETIVITEDMVMHYEKNAAAKTQKITDKEFQELQQLVHSKEFLELDRVYANSNILDGVSQSVEVDDKYVMVENTDAPPVLRKIFNAFEALKSKYIEQ